MRQLDRALDGPQIGSHMGDDAYRTFEGGCSDLGSGRQERDQGPEQGSFQ
jgi:hypothetical protein